MDGLQTKFIMVDESSKKSSKQKAQDVVKNINSREMKTIMEKDSWEQFVHNLEENRRQEGIFFIVLRNISRSTQYIYSFDKTNG